jgi:hypothetical protein
VKGENNEYPLPRFGHSFEHVRMASTELTAENQKAGIFPRPFSI